MQILLKERRRKGLKLSENKLISLAVSFSVSQLSQPGASLDNRVPTPASATSADLHSQQVGADLPVQEVKAETHHNQQEFEAAGGKMEPKMEVG